MIHTIGIDIQDSFTHSAIRENKTVNMVGDGRRIAIPTVALNKSWGTNAYQQLPSEWGALDVIPFLETHPVFWEQLVYRMYEYLGKLAPDLTNNYQTVVTSLVSDAAAFEKLIQKLGLRTAIPQIEIISATDAFLARWLSDESVMHTTGFQRVCAVVLGNRHSMMTLFQKDIADHWKPTRHLLLSDIGCYMLYDGLAGQLQRFLTTSLSVPVILHLRDAIDEFLLRLASQPVGQPLNWQGPLRTQMKRRGKVFSLSQTGLRDTAFYTAFFQQNILTNLTALVNGPVDCILFGGPGARWLVDKRPFAQIGNVWQSDRPDWDLAIGATQWSLLRERIDRAQLDLTTNMNDKNAYQLLRNRFGR